MKKIENLADLVPGTEIHFETTSYQHDHQSGPDEFGDIPVIDVEERRDYTVLAIDNNKGEALLLNKNDGSSSWEKITKDFYYTQPTLDLSNEITERLESLGLKIDQGLILHPSAENPTSQTGYFKITEIDDSILTIRQANPAPGESQKISSFHLGNFGNSVYNGNISILSEKMSRLLDENLGVDSNLKLDINTFYSNIHSSFPKNQILDILPDNENPLNSLLKVRHTDLETGVVTNPTVRLKGVLDDISRGYSFLVSFTAAFLDYLSQVKIFPGLKLTNQNDIPVGTITGFSEKIQFKKNGPLLTNVRDFSNCQVSVELKNSVTNKLEPVHYRLGEFVQKFQDKTILAIDQPMIPQENLVFLKDSSNDMVLIAQYLPDMVFKYDISEWVDSGEHKLIPLLPFQDQFGDSLDANQELTKKFTVIIPNDMLITYSDPLHNTFNFPDHDSIQKTVELITNHNQFISQFGMEDATSPFRSSESSISCIDIGNKIFTKTEIDMVIGQSKRGVNPVDDSLANKTLTPGQVTYILRQDLSSSEALNVLKKLNVEDPVNIIKQSKLSDLSNSNTEQTTQEIDLKVQAYQNSIDQQLKR